MPQEKLKEKDQQDGKKPYQRPTLEKRERLVEVTEGLAPST